MCGIAGGIYSGLGRPQAEAVTARLSHRGPDDAGVWMDDAAWLGNTRLAIQDISERGRQPMQTPDGRYTLVFNGEIYNHNSLRKKPELRGIPFRSTCDTETLLYAFAAWGAGCLPMLEGDFAFAIHDAVRSELFLARDPIGVRPLYCYNDGRQFLFASELSAISGLPALDYALAPEVLAQYLLFQYSPSADTPFRYIKKLLPGHCATISLSGRLAVDTQQYYHIPFSGRYDSGNEQYRVRLLDERLRGVVSRQLQADVPVGLMLSGGLDSSLIAALARKVDPGRDIRAFTINTHGAMRGEGFGDDFRFAQMVAAQQGIRLHEVSGGLDIAGELDSLIMQLGEPQADPAALHMSHIAAAAKDRGIKVLLSGAGGDDVFSGYRRHSAIPLFRIMAKLPPSVRSIVEQLSWQFPGSSGLRRLVKLSAGAGLPPDVAMMHTHFWARPERVAGLFLPGVLERRPDEEAYRLFRDLSAEIPDEGSMLNKMLFLELRTFLPHHNLAYMDKLGMAHSVEVRVPFADREIIALAAALPPDMKLRGGKTKYILRELAKPYLPQPVIQRKKTGFSAPLRSWMKGPGQRLVRERLLDASFLRRGIFSSEGIDGLNKDNQRGRTDGAYTLFSLLAIESWLRQLAPPA